MKKPVHKSEVVLRTASGGLTADDLQFDAQVGGSDARYSPEAKAALDNLVEEVRARKRAAIARSVEEA